MLMNKQLQGERYEYVKTKTTLVQAGDDMRVDHCPTNTAFVGKGRDERKDAQPAVSRTQHLSIMEQCAKLNRANNCGAV